MFRKIFLLSIIIVFVATINAQNSSPSPTPKVETSQVKRKKITNVLVSNSPSTTTATTNDVQSVVLPTPNTESEEEKQNRLKAGEAALARENEKAAKDAEEKARIAFEAKEKALKEELEKERIAHENEINQIKSANEADKQKKVEEEQLNAKRIEEERLAKQKEIDDANKRFEEESKQKAEAQAEVSKAQDKLNQIENQRLESEKKAKELLEKENQTKLELRQQLILTTAKKLKFLNPLDALNLVPEGIFDANQIEETLVKAVKNNPRLIKLLSFCDADFVGDPFTMDITGNIPMRTFLERLRYFYQVNFLPDSEVLDLLVQVNVSNVPWNIVLQSQLNFLDLEAKCTDNQTIAILKRSKLQTLQDNIKKSLPLRSEFIKLKYLQASVGGNVNVAGRGSNNSNPLESLENSINKVLKADGDNRGSVSRIPGRNEFIITATDEQLVQIKQIIARTDKPAYQVVIYSSILTANETKFKDVGGQVNVVGGTADLGLLGGLLGFGNSTSAGGSSSSSASGNTRPSISDNLKPGGVPQMGQGFSSPNGGTTFGFSNLFGTTQLSAQLSLLSQRGFVKIDNRPFVAVLDGQTTDLQIGRQIAIPIQSQNNFGGSPGQIEILNAGNTLNVTPQVIEDENGKPVAVTLQVRIESNDVDTTVASQGVPSIIRRSAQTSLMLNQDQTAIIGGFSTDTETNSQTKTPGLGDVPLIGNLFKRKIKAKNSDRLYFTIRVVVINQGEVLNTIPLKIDNNPKLPGADQNFFKPQNNN